MIECCDASWPKSSVKGSQLGLLKPLWHQRSDSVYNLNPAWILTNHSISFIVSKHLPLLARIDSLHSRFSRSLHVSTTSRTCLSSSMIPSVSAYFGSFVLFVPMFETFSADVRGTHSFCAWRFTRDLRRAACIHPFSLIYPQHHGYVWIL